ncbi:amidase [Albimonas pacifica]|uniref:Amidase/aspartyl-tRNA(Asn)/glutamyl-tRNA(Gln) amidotransferase subunit A n=1 Tax=Albimonas pacifica TaxID=1114924 RepID=A0A1I3BMT8_9RHOB|nr:amidase [Albimonas pacifica]SFH63572.1 amidase/aspartyl-tRNA(Asn)/glutamyl-tRNA(Gln) amidotransferase subunit A [Albimonas pacifica]
MLDTPRRATPMDQAPDLCRLGASALADGYARGAVSPVEVARAALARAEACHDETNAFVLIDADRALEQARASEARWRAGAPLSPVDGVPATIKDIVAVAGWPARYGSHATDPAPQAADAPAVARMRAAGLTFLGLTATPEFGWKAVTDGGTSGGVVNPWDRALTAGGSSGGAGAAAAFGAGVFHLGTDGGGSIRIPSAFCGICGIKPTFGRVAAFPASPFGTVAHLGPMTRRAEDMEAMLAVMAGRDLADWLQGEGRLPALSTEEFALDGARLGVWRTPPSGALDRDVAAAFDAALATLVDAGAELVEIELPMVSELLGIFKAHWYAGAAARLSTLDAQARAAVDPGMQAIAAEAERGSVVDYLAAVSARAAFGAAMDRLAEGLDLIVSPAVAVPPFKAGEEVPPGSGLPRWIEWAGFSYPINLSQQPAASMPMGRTRSGAPLGLQAIAGRGRDARVCAFARAWQALRPESFL